MKNSNSFEKVENVPGESSRSDLQINETDENIDLSKREI